jgi:hypothetical protein
VKDTHNLTIKVDLTSEAAEAPFILATIGTASPSCWGNSPNTLAFDITPGILIFF